MKNVPFVSQCFSNQFEFFFLCDGADNVLKSPGAAGVARYLDELLAADLVEELNSLVNLEVLNEL